MAPHQATAADSPMLTELLEDAATGLRSRRGGEALYNSWLHAEAASEAFAQTTSLIGRRPYSFFLDAESRGLSLAWVDDSIGWVACYVRVEARRSGVGPELMGAAMSWLHGKCDTVDALALPGDREWKSLLEKVGFKARLLTLRQDA